MGKRLGLPAEGDVLERPGRRDGAAEVVAGEIPASGSKRAIMLRQRTFRSSHRPEMMGTLRNSSTVRARLLHLHVRKVGQFGQLPGDRSRQAVVVDAPVEGHGQAFGDFTSVRMLQKIGRVLHGFRKLWFDLRLTGTAGT